MSHALRFLAEDQKEGPIEVTVVGDVMVDEYFTVDANRVSPEFPIPVLRSLDHSPTASLPGGAGNVCAQFKYFNTKVKLFGFLDHRSHDVLEANGIDTSNCVLLPPRCLVPVKRRFYQGQFPLCRWDVEKDNYGLDVDQLHRLQQELFDRYCATSHEVIIFSDYNKGLFCNSFPWAAKQFPNVPIKLVDPKKGPLNRWYGCTLLKPNYKEAKELTGESDWLKQADKIMETTHCMAAVITMGGDGLVGKVADREFEYIPHTKVSAESVIGAGDCFMAFLAMGLGRMMDVVDAVELAYEAGAVYVQKHYNKPITPHELKRHIDPHAAKLVSKEFLSEYPGKVVFTNGCFDILHRGHLEMLKFAKCQGDALVVAVNSDESVSRLKGEGRPINNLCDRMSMLAGLDCVDFVISFEEETPYETIKQIQPDVLVKGSDWKGAVVGSDLVEDVRIFDLVEGLSTTKTLQKLGVEKED